MEWQMGQRADGKDSIARQVAPESHWPELRVLILVVSGSRAETVPQPLPLGPGCTRPGP